MIPMVKTHRGILVQFSPAKLELVRKACDAYKLELSKLLLMVRDLPSEAANKMRAEIRELREIVDCIENNQTIWANSPPRDFDVDNSLINGTIEI